MKTKPMAHQITGLARSEGKRNFAFFMEQGCGKTWLTLADAERCYIGNKIDALLIVAPNGVHTNWIRREIPTHLGIPAITYVWKGAPSTKKAKVAYEALYARHNSIGETPLRVFAINIEGLNTKHGYDAVENFLDTFRTMMAVDESTRIKNPKSLRTKKAIALGRKAIARRILTGTPITKAPTDLYSQFDFLKSGLLGTNSYRAFFAEFAVLLDPYSPKMQAILRKTGGKGGIPQVVEEDENGNKMWKNLDKLSEMIAPHSYRVRKADCLDLPPKVYKVVYFEMEPAQRTVYERLKDDYHYIHNDEDMSFEAIATRTKLKQVTSGFINILGKPQLIDPKDNPRLATFREVIENIEGQFIVWAMFEEEINQIVAALANEGISAVTYYGKTSKDDRELAIDNFQAGKVRAFVGHAQAAGIGLTLTAAETAIYYSCSFDNELRMQSEDRNHRIGTTKSVLYIDLIAEDSIDEDVQRSLAVKTALADQVIDQR
jgi:SNF2 family DNA or RNA helicase